MASQNGLPRRPVHHVVRIREPAVPAAGTSLRVTKVWSSTKLAPRRVHGARLQTTPALPKPVAAREMGDAPCVFPGAKWVLSRQSVSGRSPSAPVGNATVCSKIPAPCRQTRNNNPCASSRAKSVVTQRSRRNRRLRVAAAAADRGPCPCTRPNRPPTTQSVPAAANPTVKVRPPGPGRSSNPIGHRIRAGIWLRCAIVAQKSARQQEPTSVCLAKELRPPL